MSSPDPRAVIKHIHIDFSKIDDDGNEEFIANLKKQQEEREKLEITEMTP